MLSFRDYLMYAEKQLSIAEDQMADGKDASWLLIPATIMAWSSIESFVNNMLDDFSQLPEGVFELHERAFLQEKKLKLMDRGEKLGQFVLEGTEYHSLEDKIFFLMAKFSKSPKSNRGDSLWQGFQRFKLARDNLVHPRRGSEQNVSVPEIKQYIQTAKQVIQLLSEQVWKKPIEF